MNTTGRRTDAQDIQGTEALPDTMRAVVQDRYGSLDVLQVAQVGSARRSPTTRCCSACTRPVSTAAPGT